MPAESPIGRLCGDENAIFTLSNTVVNYWSNTAAGAITNTINSSSNTNQKEEKDDNSRNP